MLKHSALQLLSLNNSTTPTCIAAIRKHRLLRRPRNVHRSARKKFVYSQHCPATVASIWSPADRVTLWRCHQNAGVVGTCSESSTRRYGKPGVDHTVLRSLQRHSPPALSPVTMELLNTQALNKKSLLIHDHIVEKGLDFMCLVETWHKPGDHLLLNEVCPPGSPISTAYLSLIKMPYPYLSVL